jgi:hypothetical protein
MPEQLTEKWMQLLMHPTRVVHSIREHMVMYYAKTTEGVREIETRERRLPPRVRSALILIDGKRSDADLAKLIQQPAETLQVLLDAGLIAVVGNGPLTKEAPAAAKAGPPGLAQSVAPELDTDLPTLRREAVRAINDLLGPEGEMLALRLERASDMKDLRAVLERAVAYIANARGGGAAAKFAARFLPGAA